MPLPHMEVLNIRILVGGGFSLTPQQKTFLWWELCVKEKRISILMDLINVCDLALPETYHSEDIAFEEGMFSLSAS